METTPLLIFTLACVICINAQSQEAGNNTIFSKTALRGNVSELTFAPTLSSPFFLENWARGVITTHNDSIIDDTALLFKYDKVKKQLIVTRDMQSILYTDRENIKSFTLITPDTNYVFYRVPEISNKNFFLLVATGKTCTVYKKIATGIKRRTFYTGGAAEYGTNGTLEYVDRDIYYIMDVSGKNKFSGKFYLTKRSIKQTFQFDHEKLSTYFKQNGKQEIDDNFLKGLVDYFNQ